MGSSDLMRPTEPPAYDPYRWIIGLLLGVGVLVNYFDRVNLSVSHEALVHSFGISAETFGYLLAAYSWTYAACQLPIGVILDRFGVRRVSLWSTAVWGIASLASAVSPAIGPLFAARLLLGVGEAPTFPANAKAVGMWFPQSERSMATAIFDSSAKLASAIGVPVLGLLLLRIGWRMSFAVTAGLSFAYLGLFALIYRDPQRYTLRDIVPVETAAPASPLEPDSFGLAIAPPIPIRRLIAQRKVLGVALGFGSYNYVFYLLLTWLPTYLITSLHTTARESFLFTGAPWLVAAVLELLIGGWITDLLIQRARDPSHVRQAVLIIGMVCGLGIFGAAYSHTVISALLWISVSIGGLSVAAAVGWSIPSLIVPNSSTGAVGGIMNFSNQLSAIAAPIVTGYVVQHTGRFFWAFAVAAGYLLVGILGYAFLLQRVEPIDVRKALAGIDD
jgi:sugar phosphate permease